MAEPENFDDEFFADLYDDNDAAPNAAAKPAPDEEPMNDAPDPSGADLSIDIQDHNGDGNMDAMNEDYDEEEEDDDDDDIDFNLGNTATHVPTIGVSAPQETPTPTSSAPPPPPPQSSSHQHGGQHKSSSSKEDGKMFIGGLNWETTDQSLRDYFSQFGEVLECTVMRDSSSGRSRGFGFLTFKDPKTVNVVMVKEHHLDGKIIDPKRAIPRDEQEKTSKIFVGGVSQETTDQEFRDYFMQFGRVVDATLMMDKDTGRPRGFGFVTFESEAGVDACLSTSLAIHGKPIEVKKAQPRGNMREEEEASRRGGKFSKNKFVGGLGGGSSGGNDNNGGNDADMVAGPNGNTNGMTPQAMAQMFQRMQQMMSMQQQMMIGRGGGQPQIPGMPQMNPAMWQQMMQYQQQQQMMMARGGQGGGPNSPMMPGMNSPMNPAMMQQMQQAMQQQMMGGQGGGNQGAGQGQGGGRPAYNAYEQQMFEQQKYEQRRQRDQSTFVPSPGSGYSQPSWDGMYEEAPQQNMGHNGGNRGGGYRGGNRQNSNDPTNAPPANAPTGPKNAGKPGANLYRGGGRGGNRFHPYNR